MTVGAFPRIWESRGGPAPWTGEESCRGQPPWWWFGTGERGDWPERKEAIRICGGCPTRDACLEYGLREKFGIWGGLGFEERRALIRRRQRDRRQGAA